ncbi:lytic transglycosylase domain-containing protein [Moraxella bovis]|uniref:Soluble lytic murein transglycosylase n=1 Tax=Moraxella bovis TaxID=476 RepID=A0A378PPR0_MORBO|nr:lytic transglycosylase domain-containing protein [Moraxella bovis]STY90270.1 Soluble lytic murein transglycosylase precursor [Moraxella bovis]
MHTKHRSSGRFLSLSTLALSVMGVSLVACANAKDYSQDGSVYQFMEAERQKSNTNAMYQYEQSMQGSLFAMYPTYWRLNNDITYHHPSTINSFVQQYPNHVISEKLVADYAEEKARQGDYHSVRAVIPNIRNADASEACAIALGHNGANDARALEQKENVWLNTQIKQSLCDKLALEMGNNRHISRTDRHEQLIRMMRIDARQLSSRNPPLDKSADIISLARQLNLAIDYGTLATIRSNPNGFFSQFHAMPFSETNQYLYVYAISQLAHRSYWEASTQLNYDINQDNARPQKLLSDMARRYAWRSIAVKRMNMNTDDGFNMEAVHWFRNSLGEPFNFEEAEDYAQAGIYFGQWTDVINAIGAMNKTKAGENVWQYWLARAYEQTGKGGQARQIYQNLTKNLDYYGLLARDRLNMPLTANDIGGIGMPNISARDTARIMQNPDFARAFKLMESGASMEYIQREWNWAVRTTTNAGDHQLVLAAAKKAHDMGIYSRSIHAMENSPLRASAISHPMPYQHSFMTHAGSAGIDPAWAYGITRQESRFAANARSGVGAGGLMQIMPNTAKMIAGKIGGSGNSSDPDTNIRYGTWYLSDKTRDFNGQIAPATAAYNAGTTPARKWLPKHGTISADQYVEAIPYSETREYVKHVMENATIYGVILGRYTPISQRMGTVSPSW